MRRFPVVWQLFLAFGLLVVVPLGALGLIGGAWMRHTGLQAVEERLRGKAALLDELVRGQQPHQLQERLNSLHEELGARITLIAADGRVLAETDRDDLDALENHGQRPEILSAGANGTGMATRYSVTTQQNMMYVARRASHPESTVAFVRVALPLADVEMQVSRLQWFAWSTAGITAALALILAWWLARRVAQPVQELRRGAAAVAGGDYGHKVYIERPNELGALAEAFNQMSERLASQFSQLDHDRQQLRAVLGSMVEGVIAIDAAQTVLFANERAGQMLEFAPQAAAGRKLWEVVRQQSVSELVQTTMRSPGKEPAKLELSGP